MYKIPIICTTVAGAMALTSKLNENLITKLKVLSDYKRFPSESKYTSKGPKIQSKDNCDLP